MSVFALVDCNNFFASCERVFDPTLKDKPIGILSNNDGCVISRSNELKKLGCKMGEPYFKCRDFERRGAVFLSSNYQLYGDMSKRVMSLLKQYVEDMEIYSIDEAFLKLDGVSDPQGFCQTLRSIILRGTGIPVSIGIASTKTLAKAANAKAKKGEGVYNLLDETQKDDLLKTLDVEDIWGISKGLGKRLKGMGLYTAYDLMEAPLKKIRKAFSVVVERMVLELRGFSTLSLNEVSDKKSIRCSRSFGEVVTDQEILTQSLINFCVRAVQKLRDQGSLVRYLSFYVRSSPFKTHESFYRKEVLIPLDRPTDNAFELIKLIRSSMPTLYKKGVAFKKAGVMLSGLSSKNEQQGHLFGNQPKTNEKSEKVMAVMDQINKRFKSKDMVFIGSQGVKRDEKTWQGRRNKTTPRYTTKWAELPIVR